MKQHTFYRCDARYLTSNLFYQFLHSFGFCRADTHVKGCKHAIPINNVTDVIGINIDGAVFCIQYLLNQLHGLLAAIVCLT